MINASKRWLTVVKTPLLCTSINSNRDKATRYHLGFKSPFTFSTQPKTAIFNPSSHLNFSHKIPQNTAINVHRSLLTLSDMGQVYNHIHLHSHIARHCSLECQQFLFSPSPFRNQKFPPVHIKAFYTNKINVRNKSRVCVWVNGE